MFIPFFGVNKKSSKKSKSRQVFDSSLLEGNVCFLPEEKFLGALGSERERAKRSGRKFVFMTLKVERIVGDEDFVETVKGLIEQLKRTIRNIDIAGWYRDGLVIGVIFTEINDFDAEYSVKRLNQKIADGLSEILAPEQLARVELCFAIVPEMEKNMLSGFLDYGESFTDIEKQRYADSGRINEDSSEYSDDQSLVDVKNEASIAHGVSDVFSRQKLLLLLGDTFLVSGVTILSAWLRFGSLLEIPGGYTGAFFLSVLFYVCAFYIFDLYNLGRAFETRDTFLRTVLSVFIGSVLASSSFYLIPQWQLGRGVFFFQTVFLTGFVSAWRVTYGRLFQKNMPKVGALILGSGKKSKAIFRLLSSPLSPYDIKGFLIDRLSRKDSTLDSGCVLGTIDQLDKITEKIWIKAAILATSGNASPDLVRKILDARLQGLEVVEMPTVYERLTGRVPVRYIEDRWLLFADGFYLISKEYLQKLKRLIDMFLSAFVLLFCSPLMAITALAIRADSPGPVFYRQDRVGKAGKIFKVIKFRSMRSDAEKQGAKWAQKDDDRVTRVGFWIRKFRVDELPQLWNVFKGEMTLIGPRPERPEFVKDLEKIIPYYGVRHAVTPGITGWAQVNYPYGASVEDALHKLEYDLFYIKNMSLLLDFKIAMKTIGVVLLGSGAR